MNDKDRAAFRIATCLKVCKLLRDSLEKNRNIYSGSLVPNLTSITDVLTLPFDVLLEQVNKTPELAIDPSQVEYMKGII